MTNDLKSRARTVVENAFPSLIALSEKLHANPETAWQEHQAVGWVSGRLCDGGFDVTTPYLGLDTAFHARVGTGPYGSACARSTTPYRGLAMPAATT